ncbi:MAG: hypothetical protein KTR32_31540 [Granulosicoccus sp.]|nr:hypothetical protein [Granulosicoccus sp.]
MKVWLAGLMVFTLAGCAVNPRSEEMVSNSVVVTNRFDDQVYVAALGGREEGDTSLKNSSLISNDNFVEAVVQGIQQHGIYRTAFVNAAPAGTVEGYQLDVAILDLTQPARGFDMTVSMTTRWELKRLATGQVIFTEFVDSSYTATVDQAFAGWKRVRLATEGAARKNIQEGLQKLSSYELN